MEAEIKQQVTTLLGDYGWMFVAGMVMLLFRSTIENAVAGLMVFIGIDYDEDDVIELDGKPGRIVRVGIWSTVFFIYHIVDGNIVSGDKLVVQNDKLKDYLKISFQNKENDHNTTEFLDNLSYIFTLIDNSAMYIRSQSNNRSSLKDHPISHSFLYIRRRHFLPNFDRLLLNQMLVAVLLKSFLYKVDLVSPSYRRIERNVSTFKFLCDSV